LIAPRRLLLSLVVVILPLVAVVGAGALPPVAPELIVRARLAFESPHIDGEVEIRWRNPGPAPADTLRLFLFANRFRSLDSMNDLARHLLIAGSKFRPGGTDIVSVEGDAGALPWRVEESDAWPAGTVVGVSLARPLLPGQTLGVLVKFRTRLPNLLDTFGASDGLVIADGGWYPQPLSLGTGEARGCPPPASARATLSLPPGGHLLLDGHMFESSERAELDAPPGDRLSLVLSRSAPSIESVRVGNRVARVYTVANGEFEHRISPNDSALEALQYTLRPVLAQSNAEGDLVLVRLPLRWYPSAVAPGMILVTDRLFEIFPLLRPLHQRELAYAVYLQEELRAARRREPPQDAAWVAEGLAWNRAQDLYRSRFREGREVKDWIRLFDVFAIVDRFETAPRIPFVRPFFPVSDSDDPLHLRLETCCDDRPPGRFIFDKLEAELRPERFRALLEQYRRDQRPMRDLLRELGGEPTARLLSAWLRPHVPVDYALADVRLNPGGQPGTRLTIERRSPEARPDSLEIGLEHAGGTEQTFVDLQGDSTTVERRTASPLRAVSLDPERRTVESRLDNNRVPAEFQLLLDSADVEVSSTEFGISSLLVGRRRYDYRKDLALAGFYTSRGYGVDAGFQLHGGQPIDANLYRQNLFAYYSIEELDSSFENKQMPALRTRGRLGGFGLRFNSYDAFWFENPAGSHHLRLFFDGYSRALGGDFDFVQGGGSLTYTLPLRQDTVVAGQVLNGYSAATAGRPIPNQGLFSLGGFRSIRGIGAEDDLANDIFVVRAELRHLLPFRLDWNFEELLIARRLQLKAFVDAGRVENSSRRLYDPAGFAVGVGGGVNLFYDFMGFFPTTFYLDVATRADQGGGAQVLFGVGQPF
jgi:Omp85 superfamily domain